MKNNFLLSTIGIIFLSVMISACKKEPKTDTTTPVALKTGTFYMHMHSNIDTTEVDTGMAVTDASHKRYSLTFAQFYLSGVVLKKADGSYYPIPDGIALKTIGTEQYLMGKVPAGDYLGVSFYVGLDSLTNTKNPTSFASTSPLAPQSPSMWFGSESLGFIFMYINGKADTSATQTGVPSMPFIYKIGSNTLLKKVTMPDKAFTVTADQGQEVHITCDYSLLLTGVDIVAKNYTDTYTTDPALANQIASNIPGMFRYEE